MCIKSSTTFVTHILIKANPLKDVYQYNTRSSEYNFLVPDCHGVDNSTFYMYYTGIKDWNSLPKWLKRLQRPHRFKAALRKHLIEHRFETDEDNFLFFCFFFVFFYSRALFFVLLFSV